MNNKIGMIADYLGANQTMRDFIDDIVEENYKDPEKPLYNENSEFIYKNKIEEFINQDNNIKDLNQEEYDLLVNLIIKDILHKIEAKTNAHMQAEIAANNEQYVDYYGSSKSAYNHQLEHYLEGYNYNKTIYDFYNEYKSKQKIK